MKTYIVGTHFAILMSTPGICFHGEIRKSVYLVTPFIWSSEFLWCGKVVTASLRMVKFNDNRAPNSKLYISLQSSINKSW